MKTFVVGMVSAVVLSAPAVFAQSTPPAAAPAQQPEAKPAARPDPSQLPPVTAADIARCGEKVPDGGVPVFLRPETPEQRAARIGTEDPGCDPDLSKRYWRYGKEYTIGKYDRYWAVFGGGEDANAIRPFGFVNSYRELYQQNEKWVWTWEAIPPPPQPVEEDLKKSTDSNRRFTDRDITYLQYIRPEFVELKPPRSPKTVRFEEASDGLPTSGSWRNSLTVADMNDDGFLDLIAPPQRAGATGIPAIFLGDGKGHWKYWEEARWAHGLDYGSVDAADFNKDGHMDLVFAVHLSGIYVMLGDGKGNFSAVETMPHDFPSRRVLTRDVNKDGLADIVAISEGPTAVQTASKNLGKIRVYFNGDKGKKWDAVDVAPQNTRVGGDYLTVGNFNGDKYLDVAAASIYMGSTSVLYLGKGPREWSVVQDDTGATVPFLSYYFASAPGKFVSKGQDDLLLSYVRFWPPDLNDKLVPKPPLTETTGIDLMTFGKNGKVVRKPVMRRGTKFGITGMGAADFDGDGKLDVAYTTVKSGDDRELGILLGDGKGNFTEAGLEGIKVEPRMAYDLKVADVNGDRKPDVIIMYESDQSTALAPRDGSIHVFVNRGAAPSAAGSK